ncbi:hypothetical protein [uncultured Methylobacterium sp.]|uniref:hypothetical protein n=1 Tax=uncultured Methylobacterium sp. TaxID=157278 RepID=UPI0035CA2FA6
MSAETTCPTCGFELSAECEFLGCPTHTRAVGLSAAPNISRPLTPIEALQRYVNGVDARTFKGDCRPTLTEWAVVVEMVLKLESSAVNVAGSDGGPLPVPAPVVAAGNVIPFRRR